MSRPQIVNDRERQQKHPGRHRRQRDQPNINHAMDFLVAAAVFATAEVVFVVAAHLRRQARNVISPARQNFAYDWINALLTHLGVPKSAKPAEPSLQPNRLQCLCLGRQ